MFSRRKEKVISRQNKIQAAFHGVGPYDVKKGKIFSNDELSYTNIFEQWLLQTGGEQENVVSVCAAMPDGTGVKAFAERYPDRAFDVGIAEEHAVTFAAGMAAGGMRPIVSLYSTFCSGRMTRCCMMYA